MEERNLRKTRVGIVVSDNAVVRGIVERKNLPGYRMEWHEELHACLLSFLRSEEPSCRERV